MSGKEAEAKRATPHGKSSRWMVAALLVAAVVLVVKVIAPQTVGEQVRRHLEQTLQEHYVGLDVTVGRGRYEPKTGLIFSDIRIAVPDESESNSKSATRSIAQRLGLASRSGRELLRVEQIVVVAHANLQKLLDKENPIVTRRIVVSGVDAKIWMDQGKFSLEKLWPFPKLGDGTCPRLELRNSKLSFENDAENGRPIEFELDEAVVLKDPDAKTPSGEPLPAGQCSSTITVKGKSTFADQIAFRVNCAANEFDIRAEARNARFSGSLVKQLPAEFRDKLQPLAGLELTADTTAVVRITPGQPINFATRSKIHDGWYRHPKSSMPIKNIRGIVSCSPRGISFESCQAFWGDARLKLDGKTSGYSVPMQAELDVSAYNLMLDQRLAAVIPKRLEAGWKKFEPRGLIDVPKARFRIEGEKIGISADVTCKGVDIVYDKFPYPVRQVSGKLSIGGERVRSDMLSGRIGGQLMQCLFDVPVKAESDAERVFSVAMDGPIAIDGELLQALTPRGEAPSKLESFIRSLNPLGAIHLVRATLRTEPGGVKHRDFELRVSDGKLRFDEFPYPLYNVTGNIRVVDNEVSLSGFQGSNANGGLIACEGDYRIPPNANNKIRVTPATFGSTMVLEFDASRIALDEALRSSLPPASQQTWDNLVPSGVVDSLKIRMTRDTPTSKIELQVAGKQFGVNRIGSDTLRLQPTALPYRLDIREAAVRYEKGQVFIDTVRAEHGGSFVSADGGCRQLPNSRWLLRIDVHNGSRLVADAELVNALPAEMRAAMRGLNLRGPVRMSGLTETLLSDENHPDPVFGWDLLLQLEGNRIGDVGPVHGLRGELSVRGRKDERGLAADGDVRIDSLHVNDLQVTRLRGPFQILDDRLRLGGVTPDGSAAIPIEGRLFDGTVQMDGNVLLSDASFSVRLALMQAKIQVLLSELGQGRTELTGTLGANMTLEGLLGTKDLLRGQGRATVENANLYQVPVLIQLLNVLSITPTEDVAFTNADIFFRLSEDELYFDDLKLWGSLIALHGNGMLDRRRELDLTFNTRVSPRNTFTRILRPLMNQQYTLWTVDVNGPIDNLDIQRRALDGVGNAIEQLFQGMNTGVEAKRKDRAAGIGRMFN